MTKPVSEKPAKNVKRKRNKETTIKRIIRKTEKMIKEKGYVKTTTNHIAKESDVSIALIYKYFPGGKPDIVQQIRRRSLLFNKISDINDIDLKNMIEPKFLDLEPEVIIERGRRFLLAYIAYHRRYMFLDNALEIAFLETMDKQKSKKEDEKKVNKEVSNESWDYDAYNKPYYQVVSNVLVHLGIKDQKLQIKLSKLLVNSFNCLIRQHINYGNLVDSDEELAQFLIDVLLGYVDLRYEFLSLPPSKKEI